MGGLLADVKTFLDDGGIFLQPEFASSDITDIYLGSMPNNPDNAVAIYSTGGFPRDLSGTMVEEPTVMVKVRHTSYPSGEGVCNRIKDSLHGKDNQTVNSHDILLIAQQGDILDLGRDERNRQMWSMNFRLYYRR